MTDRVELCKRFFYYLLEQILFVIIILFIFIGIYIPIRSVSKQLDKDWAIIKITAPKDVPLYINGKNINGNIINEQRIANIKIIQNESIQVYTDKNVDKSASSISLVYEDGKLSTKDENSDIKITKTNGSYNVEIKK